MGEGRKVGWIQNELGKYDQHTSNEILNELIQIETTLYMCVVLESHYSMSYATNLNDTCQCNEMFWLKHFSLENFFVICNY